jgi:hypothetical protein
MIPEQTDGVTVYGSHARDMNQHYALSLEHRNAIDLADWLLNHNLTKAQHKNILDMMYSKDDESQFLALEIIKVKKEQFDEKKSSYESKR